MSAVISIFFKNLATGASTCAPTGSFDVISWHWGMSQSASAQFGNTNQGSADVHDLTFTKVVDKSSPVLIKDCFGAVDEVEVTLSLWNTTNNKTWPYMTVKMGKKVIISSYNTGDFDSQDRLLETVTLNFATVAVSYTPQNDKKDAGSATGGDTLDITKHAG